MLPLFDGDHPTVSLHFTRKVLTWITNPKYYKIKKISSKTNKPVYTRKSAEQTSPSEHTEHITMLLCAYKLCELYPLHHNTKVMTTEYLSV